MGKENLGGSGEYQDYGSKLELLKNLNKKLPKHVKLKHISGKLYFRIQIGEKRTDRASNIEFSDIGLHAAFSKAWEIKRKLDEVTKESDFWEWYDTEVLGKRELEVGRTYREIFQIIEEKFWNSLNKNTKRKRDKSIPNDVHTYQEYYGQVFDKFPNWDKEPDWEEIKTILFSWKRGTKSFKDAYAVVKKICSLSDCADKLLTALSEIDNQQTIFKEKQSISLKEFLSWRNSLLGQYPDSDYVRSWLWVCSACVVYGLRPSEAFAIENLFVPYQKQGVNIPALNSPNNKDFFIVLGDTTKIGTTIKTGARVCRPLATELIEQLEIDKPIVPNVAITTTNAKVLTNKIGNRFRKFLTSYKCPTTQAYAFRHLANQLGEKNGIPQEIRARSLGHSVSVNESTYKKRNNLVTSLDLLKNHARQPLDLESAVNRLKDLGVDVENPDVKLILRIIYNM